MHTLSYIAIDFFLKLAGCEYVVCVCVCVCVCVSLLVGGGVYVFVLSFIIYDKMLTVLK